MVVLSRRGTEASYLQPLQLFRGAAQPLELS
jgi:hypothetical protein